MLKVAAAVFLALALAGIAYAFVPIPGPVPPHVIGTLTRVAPRQWEGPINGIGYVWGTRYRDETGTAHITIYRQ